MPRHLFTAAPSTPVELLAAAVRQHLYMPDPGALYVLMGAVAGSMLEGQPIYLMLIGPPSCGGSALLDMLTGMPSVVGAGLIESPAAFLSGTGKRDRDKSATGGLLGEIGRHGAIVLKDFTTILSLHPEIRRKVMGVFRECYDDKWERGVGTDGGKTLVWEGRLAAFAKCTGEIDHHAMLNSTLGERWVYYRYPATDGYAQARQALLNSGKSGWQADLRCLTHAMFEGLDLRYGGKAAIRLAPRRALTDLEISRIINLATVASKCRSGVSRDPYKHDVTSVPESENQARLAGELQQIYIGMETVGVPDRMRWKLTEKVAMDSMPRIRRMILEEVKTAEKSYRELQKVIGCSQSVVIRAVEDLELHGVLSTRAVVKGLLKPEDGGGGEGKGEGAGEGGEKDNARVRVGLSEWMKKEWKALRRAHE